jgi:hypothetical protein
MCPINLQGLFFPAEVVTCALTGIAEIAPISANGLRYIDLLAIFHAIVHLFATAMRNLHGYTGRHIYYHYTA